MHSALSERTFRRSPAGIAPGIGVTANETLVYTWSEPWNENKTKTKPTRTHEAEFFFVALMQPRSTRTRSPSKRRNQVLEGQVCACPEPTTSLPPPPRFRGPTGTPAVQALPGFLGAYPGFPTLTGSEEVSDGGEHIEAFCGPGAGP